MHQDFLVVASINGLREVNEGLIWQRCGAKTQNPIQLLDSCWKVRALLTSI